VANCLHIIIDRNRQIYAVYVGIYIIMNELCLSHTHTHTHMHIHTCYPQHVSINYVIKSSSISGAILSPRNRRSRNLELSRGLFLCYPLLQYWSSHTDTLIRGGVPGRRHTTLFLGHSRALGEVPDQRGEAERVAGRKREKERERERERERGEVFIEKWGFAVPFLAKGSYQKRASERERVCVPVFLLLSAGR